MVLKSHNGLSFSFLPRLGFGSSQKADSSNRSRNAEKPQEDWYIPYNGPYEMPKDIASTGHHHSGGHDNDPFRSTPLLGRVGGASPSIRSVAVGASPVPGDSSRSRANTFSGPMQPPTLLIPNIDGGIGESPIPLQRSPVSPVRSKRASRINFFAFSGRKLSHGVPIIQFPQSQRENTPDLSMPGGWPSEKVIKPKAHVADPTSVPPALRTDEEDYYYSYYSALTPTFPLSRSATPRVDSTNPPSFNQLSSRHRDHLDPNSQHSSPVDYSHTRLQHPYAYPSPSQEQHPQTPLESDSAQLLQHTDSLQHRLQASRTGVNPTPNIMPTSSANSQVKWETQLRHQPLLRASTSVPNLASAAKSSLQPPGKMNAVPASRRQERWLAAETWCDALLFPRPRFKVKQGPWQYTGASQRIVTTHIEGDPNGSIRAGSPGRPRSVSATLNTARARPTLTKSRSAADLRKPSTGLSRSGFEPALETLVDEPTPRESVADHVPSSEAELSLPDPPPSLTQVIEEGECLQRQRDQWKLQASKSLGNKHTRSLSRVRSRSVSENHVRGRRKSEGGKGQSHLEFLAARTLLGNQSVMPMVHVSKPSGSSSSHSKSYSHSHSQSSHSHTHSQTSHSHSYSLTTSNSSKSSRNPHRHGHSRNGSWGKTALMKAGALCGVGKNDSYNTPEDDKPPLFSRVDEPSGVSLGNPATGALDDVHFDRMVSPVPSVPIGEVGVAISSPPPERNAFPNLNMEDLSMPGHPFSGDPSYPRSYGVGHDTQEEAHATPKHMHKSSEYAGPHRSAFDPNLPPPTATSDVSMRHRLPPRANVHLGTAAHPYGLALAQMGEPAVSGMGGHGAVLQVPRTGTSESPAGHDLNPHLSLTNPDFERYGVGEALVYASFPRPEDIIRPKAGDVRQPSPPEVESPHRMDEVKTREQSPSRDTVVQAIQETPGGSSELSSDPPSTAPTADVAARVFDSSDDLDEFQDLFYQPPHCSSSGDEHRESSIISRQITCDLPSSESGSALTNLVRSLGEEMEELRALTLTPSDSTRQHRSEDHANRTSSTSGLKYVLLDPARALSSSPIPMDSPTQVPFPIQQEGEPATQLSVVIPEDVVSSAASSVLESPEENDTFGYPIRHGLVEAVAPFPVHTPRRTSTHLSIMDGIEGQADVLNPVTAHDGSIPSSAEAIRSSTLTTTSDNSRMSELSDFPLPPSARPGIDPGHVSILSYLDATCPSPDSQFSDIDTLALSPPLPAPPSHDMSYDSRRTTFGASADIDVIAPQIQVSTP
ncbi:hypothetical protein PAXINDRAFT_169592 [Paxillus involutus ATCC 200175]|uniref:Uncharacterized protein n=1 Tax=Paxillus involutus ATCC 200175 TaxID=664439 RepID=A0A0C9TG91_PAXIN|nr:hypothetical protein PAXINDRAFT_169592 [Paxillus involutus ATCC 200175]